jgi:hypothetical protein
MGQGADKSHSLIELTPNPYVAFGIRLGRDELFAGLSSAFWTFLFKLGFIWLCASLVGSHIEMIVLAIVGPVFEKPALFTKYIIDAWGEYKSTDPHDRRQVRYYLKRVWREGWPTLRADLLYHDPAYSALLWFMLWISSGAGLVSVAVLSAVSFITAVAIASIAEVIAVECAYIWRHRRLRTAGFVMKSYYEARFLLDPDGDPNHAPQIVLDHLQEQFDLNDRKVFTYRDVYVTENCIAVYNGRKPYLRFRLRLTEDGEVSKQAVQVMHTLSREVKIKSPGLYRCYAMHKRKLGYDFPLDGPMPWDSSEIPDARVGGIVKGLQSGDQRREVRFSRDVAMGDTKLFISVDTPAEPKDDSGRYWLEVKVRDNLDLLREVSDYIAWKLPVRAATQSRLELFDTDEQ